nr:hypothetical protein [uncultured Oscillibacter sp.]
MCGYEKEFLDALRRRSLEAAGGITSAWAAGFWRKPRLSAKAAMPAGCA